MGRFAPLFAGLALIAVIGFVLSRDAARPEESPVDVAWAAVRDRPQDPAAWVRLGEVQVEANENESAEHALRTALALGDESGLAYARLGFLLYGQGKDTEARSLLATAKRRGADVPMLDFTLAALADAPAGAAEAAAPPPSAPPRPAAARPLALDAGFGGLDASSPAPPPPVAEAPPPPPAPPPPASRPRPVAPPVVEGPCTLALSRKGRGVYLVDVVVNGAAGRLILDTGASITVLNEAFADRAGLRLDRRRVIHAITANGRVDMPTAVAPEIEVGPYAADATRVAVCPECVESLADGLLGLDLQASFHMELDLAQGQVRFGRCE